MLRIALVEDNPAISAPLRRLLTARSCAVFSFARASADAVMACDPELVLCDVDLPGTDGITLASSLRALGYRGLIVFITGLPAEVVASFQDGLSPCRVLEKPFGLDQVARFLEAPA
jgi:DNA-binding response OmpR family regulator